MTAAAPTAIIVPARFALKPPSAANRVRPALAFLQAIVSGGQTGADRAGLRAARRLGLATGGFAPRGWMTTAGPDPSLADFGLIQHPGRGYPPRTSDNVRLADATLRVARDFSTAGELCTRRAIARWGKPHFDILARGALSVAGEAARIDALVEFLVEHRVRILNVAGNSEETGGGAPFTNFVTAFLIRALGDSDAR